MDNWEKSTLKDLKSARETVKLVNSAMCEDAEYYCEKCNFKINGMCIIMDAETALNLIIRQYEEHCRLKPKTGVIQ